MVREPPTESSLSPPKAGKANRKSPILIRDRRLGKAQRPEPGDDVRLGAGPVDAAGKAPPKESFLSLGEKLGYLDREMQVAQLTLLEEELGYRIKTLKSAMPKQQKTYQSMGILGGILLAVLLW